MEDRRSNNEVREILLQYFYGRNRNATSARGKDGSAVKINDVKKELQSAHGLTRQEVQSNLTYLVTQGWIEEEKIERSFTVPGGTQIPSMTSFYRITAAGIDRIETANGIDNIAAEKHGRIAFVRHEGYRLAEKIVVDGRIDNDSLVSRYSVSRMAHVRDREIASALLQMPFSEIRVLFVSVKLPLLSVEHHYVNHVEINWDRPEHKPPTISFPMSVDLPTWAKPWSALEFLDSVASVIAPSSGHEAKLSYSKDRFDGRFEVSFAMPLPKSLEDSIERYAPLAIEIVDTASNRLEDQARRDSLVTFFEFPEEVSAAAQQYLMYFVQFLRDLGIDAKAELKQQAGRVLFSVTPSSEDEALERVREALRIYLNLPSVPEFIAATDTERSIAVTQLRSNVLHLQSQLMLAKATMQAKDAAIESLQIATYEYRQLLLSSGASSDAAGQAPATEKEPLLGDAVAITKYSGNGFEIDLPKLLRRLKRKFKRQ